MLYYDIPNLQSHSLLRHHIYKHRTLVDCNVNIQIRLLLIFVGRSSYFFKETLSLMGALLPYNHDRDRLGQVFFFTRFARLEGFLDRAADTAFKYPQRVRCAVQRKMSWFVSTMR